MAKYDKKIIARRMRKEGISILTIAKKLSVAKSSVSMWCRDILLNPEQKDKLKKQKGSSFGRWKGAESNRNKKIDAINSADLFGRKFIGNISKREMLLIATALYWCEGSKSDYTSGFVFVNSDPEMVLLMKLFLLKNLNIPPEDLTCSVQINRIHEKRINKVLNFWEKLLQLPKNQFRKPYYVNTKVSKVYDNYEDYYGVCRLIVKKGMNLKYRMIGLIKAIRSNILSA